MQNYEIIDVYNEEGKIIRQCIRDDSKPMAGFFLSVHLIVISKNNKFIVQKRKNKAIDNGKWDILSGVVKSGESSYEAAYRELYEELSIKKNDCEISYKERIMGKKNIMDIYIVKLKRKMHIEYQHEEISEIKYIDSKTLYNIFDSSDKEEELKSCIYEILFDASPYIT